MGSQALKPIFARVSALLVLAIILSAGHSVYAEKVLKVSGKQILIERGALNNGDAVEIFGKDSIRKGSGKVIRSKGVRAVVEMVEGSASVGDVISIDEISLDDSKPPSAIVEVKSRHIKGFWLGVGYDFGGPVELKMKSADGIIDVDEKLTASGTPTIGFGYMNVGANRIGGAWIVGAGGTRNTGDAINKPTGTKIPMSHSISHILYVSANIGFVVGAYLNFAEIELGVPSVKLKESSSTSGSAIGAGFGYGVFLGEHHIVHVANRFATDSAPEGSKVKGTVSVVGTHLSYRYLF